MASKKNSSGSGIGYSAGGIAFVGCTTLGVGLGLAFGNPGAGSVIGTGAGFLVMALFVSRRR